MPQLMPQVNLDPIVVQKKADILDVLVNAMFPKGGGQAQASSMGQPTAPQMNKPQMTPQQGMDTSQIQTPLNSLFSQSGMSQRPAIPQEAGGGIPQIPQQPAPRDNTAIFDFLKQMGIPIAAAVAGTAFPGMLPGAAGLSTGFNTGMEGAREREAKKKKESLEERKLELQELKAAQSEELMRQNIELLKSVSQGGTGNLPIGTTLKSGPLTIPLNREFSDAERSVIAETPLINASIDKIINLIDSGVAKSTVGKALVDMGNPLFVTGGAEDLQSSLNYLKGTVPFTKGGKALTKTELLLTSRLLNTLGKNDKTIKKDLNRYREIFSKLENLVKYGEENNLSPEIFNNIKSKILQGLPTDISPAELKDSFNTPNKSVQDFGLDPNKFELIGVE